MVGGPAGNGLEERLQSPTGLLKAASAQGAHEGLQSGSFLRCGGCVAGGEEPVKLVFGKRAGEPAEHQVSRAGQRHLAERNAERELEERGAVGAGAAEKYALNLAAAFGCVLGHYQDAAVGIGGQPPAAPEGARGHFGLIVASFVEVDRCGRVAAASLPPVAPGVEYCLLDRENAIEAGQQKRQSFRLAGS